MNAMGLTDEVDEEGLPLLPMKTQTILRVLGEIGKQRDDGSTVTCSTVNGYYAAIRYAHTSRAILMVEDTTGAISDFLKGVFFFCLFFFRR